MVFECVYCEEIHRSFREWDACGAAWMTKAVRGL